MASNKPPNPTITLTYLEKVKASIPLSMLSVVAFNILACRTRVVFARGELGL